MLCLTIVLESDNQMVYNPYCCNQDELCVVKNVEATAHFLQLNCKNKNTVFEQLDWNVLLQPTCGHCKIMLDLGSVSIGEAQRIYKMLTEAQQSAKRLQNFFH